MGMADEGDRVMEQNLRGGGRQTGAIVNRL